MSLLQFSIILTIICVGTVSEVCTPKFLLQDLIHQSVSIYSFTTTNSITTATAPFTFEQSFFKTKPKIITSINQLSCSQFKEINYLLSTQIQGSSVIFKLSTSNMRWTSLEINFLLHSRDDLFSITRTITTAQIEKQTTVSYRLEGANQSKQYAAINFIVGVLASPSKTYSLSITPFSISTGKYQIKAISTTRATITVQSLYFLASQDKFVYSYNSYQWSQSSNSKTITLWDDFAPNVYTIFGFTSWTITGNSFSLSSRFNIIKNTIAIQNFQGISNLNVSYFGLGQLPSKICSPCDNFITISGCIDKCPSQSYGEKLPGGGKICRSCDQNIGQYVNDQGNACICKNGLTFHQGRCLSDKEFSEKCRPYEVIVNGKCTSRLVGLTYECPAKSILNSAGICVCQSGFLMSASKECISICPTNSIYNQGESACNCNYNYQMIKGVCVPCSSQQSYNSQSKVCVAKTVDPSGKVVICGANQIIIDNSCQCLQNNYILNRKCVPCPAETYKVANFNKCAQCPAYCSSCFSSFECSKCNSGFKISSQGCDQICGDGKKFILPCDDGNTVNGDGCSSDCQIQPNYVCNGGNSKRPDICSLTTFNDVLEIKRPSISFLSSGIVTEFVVTPPIKRTPEELASLFSVSFTKKNLSPQNIFFSQSTNDYRSIRCYFAYHNNIPNDIFSATFEMTDKTFGYSKIVLLYNPFKGGITSAIVIGSEDYKEDILVR